ncbi:MAG: N-acetylmuramic acid 6-phosphate etherase [Acidobacteriaceae bacterium]
MSSTPSADPTLATLLTETRNPISAHIDELPTIKLLQVINAADAEVAAAVALELPQIARVVDAIVERMERGGRLFYTGAGTSGRLGVLDASECPPTFNVRPELVQGIIAGGDHALRQAVEGAEDSPELGSADLATHGFEARDALVGIAASGRTPYVLGALTHARAAGAVTIGLSCVPNSAVASAAEYPITPAVGPEIITGSTRMRAGTATKLVLNMLSTGVMVRLGMVYGNLMINVQPTNAKLADRAARIVTELTGLDRPAAVALLDQAGSIKAAVLMHRHGLTRSAAEELLRAHRGHLRRALESLSAGPGVATPGTPS